MKKFVLLLLIHLFINNNTYSQDFKIFKGDTINRTDAKGTKLGVWKRFYENDQLFSETTFKNGKPTGETRMFYKSGEKQGIMNYDKDGKTARMISYWPNGKIKAAGKYINQEKDSTWNYYNELDTLTSVENFKAGKPHGLWKIFYPNGKISEETMYADGLKNGPCKKYYTNGILKMSGTYLNDTFNGSLLHFYMDGKPYIKGNFADGLKEGEWLYLNENGATDSTEIYSNGVLQPK